jgi:asparagine synthase (glutamine-hydrolysing)
MATAVVAGPILEVVCGIVALWSAGGLVEPEQLVNRMTEALVHRGPDEVGTVVLADDGVALGMRRLSILDLEGGHQPMWDERGRCVLVFNGEIYNFAALRHQLVGKGHVFATDHSDTEVIVHGYEEWGVDLFSRLNGMFAVAIWDRDARRLVIARDRVGEKPLYVAKLPSGYAVASELKALMLHPDLDRSLDPVALEQFLVFDYALTPRTVLASVRKVPPGHHAVIDAVGYREDSFWTPRLDGGEGFDEKGVLDRLDAHLDRSVAMRMVADVPVGLFLSGGLDSTTIGYYMRRHSDRVESFSIGFEDAQYDETEYARVAAQALGTQHHVEVLSQRNVLSIVPKLPEILDEPMADQSILPTFLLSQFTRQSVKVALGGDGGDELFLGYNAHQGFRIAGLVGGLPSPLAALAAASAQRLPRRVGSVRLRGLGWVAGHADSVTGRVLTQQPDVRGFRTDARRVLAADLQELLPASVFDGTEAPLLRGLPATATTDDQATVAYLRAYLADDILVKVDRASMAASLEVRAPFLDTDLIDFLLAVPASLKLKRLRRKHLLRALMRDRLPTAIVDRRKFGFNAPVEEWIGTALAPLVREYLDPPRVAAARIFDARSVERLVDAGLNGHGTGDQAHLVWKLLQFELWRERWLT